MTYEKAISNLKYLISEDCTDTQFDYIDEIELAIDALEKRMPKKPNDKFNVPYDILACGICPSCGLGVNSDMKFCSECGRAIDWR